MNRNGSEYYFFFSPAFGAFKIPVFPVAANLYLTAAVHIKVRFALLGRLSSNTLIYLSPKGLPG